MKLNRNQWIMVGGVALTVLIVGGVLISSGKNKVEEKVETEALPTEVVIPTVDSTVKVDLKQGAVKGEAKVTIKNAPKGTKSIDFELSYNAQSADAAGTTLQGAIGSCEEDDGVWECGESSSAGRKIVLGTCSSGTCRYHDVVGKIRLNLRFTGDYGDKVFEKEYQL